MCGCIRASIRQDTVPPRCLTQDEAVTSTASRDMNCQKRWPAVEHQLKETLSRTLIRTPSGTHAVAVDEAEKQPVSKGLQHVHVDCGAVLLSPRSIVDSLQFLRCCELLTQHLPRPQSPPRSATCSASCAHAKYRAHANITSLRLHLTEV